jgi:hypothetical protein
MGYKQSSALLRSVHSAPVYVWLTSEKVLQAAFLLLIRIMVISENSLSQLIEETSMALRLRVSERILA